MTLQDRATFRSVILPSENTTAAQRAGKLLDELGHEVSAAVNAEEAWNLLQQEETDLLVVDVTDSSRNRDFLGRLMELPLLQRPRELAIFSEVADDSLRTLRSRISPSKVHVFLKPLHMHGLMRIIRKLQGEE